MAPASAAPARVVAVFDFDGTISRRDTLAPFLARLAGRRVIAAAFAREAASVALWLAVRRDVDEVKRRIVRRTVAGVPVIVGERAGRAHAEAMAHGLRGAALARVRWHREQGHVLVLASAGLDLYLGPLGQALGFDHVLCSRLAVRPGDALAGDGARGFFTGELDGPDCTGVEKLRRLEALLGGLAGVELHAYGDSAGDAALLAAATHAHWKPFRGR
ncbi:MAG TPA: HAD-IB family hydrolase [Burkholderiaceae bacterium]